MHKSMKLVVGGGGVLGLLSEGICPPPPEMQVGNLKGIIRSGKVAFVFISLKETMNNLRSVASVRKGPSLRRDKTI